MREVDDKVVIPSSHLALKRGEKLFKDGKPAPEDIWSDEQWRGPLCIGQVEILGWACARAETISPRNRR